MIQIAYAWMKPSVHSMVAECEDGYIIILNKHDTRQEQERAFFLQAEFIESEEYGKGRIR